MGLTLASTVRAVLILAELIWRFPMTKLFSISLISSSLSTYRWISALSSERDGASRGGSASAGGLMNSLTSWSRSPSHNSWYSMNSFKILDPGSRKELTAELSTMRFLAKSEIKMKWNYNWSNYCKQLLELTFNLMCGPFTFVTLDDRIPILKIFWRNIFNDFSFVAIFIQFSNQMDSMLTPSSNWFASFDNVSSSLVQHLLELVQWWNELNMWNSQIDIDQEKWLFKFIRPKFSTKITIWASKIGQELTISSRFLPICEILSIINASWIDESFVFFELMTRFLMISSDCFKQKVIFSRHRFLKYWITSRQFCSKTDSFFSSPRFEAFEFAAVGAAASVWRTSMLKSGGTSVGSSWDTKTYKQIYLVNSKIGWREIRWSG